MELVIKLVDYVKKINYMKDPGEEHGKSCFAYFSGEHF
jgi:hypothetical protein